MAKEFSVKDLYRGSVLWYVNADREDLVVDENYSEDERKQVYKAAAAGGYGRNVPSRYRIRFEGRSIRIRYTCFSNVASHFFTADRRTVYIA